MAGNLPAGNPLAGLPVLQVEQLRLQRQRHLRQTEHIVRQVLRADTTTLHLTVLQVLTGLASQTQGFTKSRLLALLQGSLPDPVRTAAIVPAIYTYLFETADTTGSLRREAMRYVEYRPWLKVWYRCYITIRSAESSVQSLTGELLRS